MPDHKKYNSEGILIFLRLLREPTNQPLYRYFDFLVRTNTSQIYNTLSYNIVFYAQNLSAIVFCGFESSKKAMQKQLCMAATKC
jgi:hypothetical protein